MIEAVQAGIYSAIDAATTTPVHGHVDQGASYPYVHLLEMELNNNDTQTETGFDGFFLVHVWDDSRTNSVARDIQKEIYDALQYAQPVVTGWCISTIYQEFATINVLNDGITRHGVQRFRILFEPDPNP